VSGSIRGARYHFPGGPLWMAARERLTTNEWSHREAITDRTLDPGVCGPRHVCPGAASARRGLSVHDRAVRHVIHSRTCLAAETRQ
jgi:hypothetical protein